MLVNPVIQNALIILISLTLTIVLLEGVLRFYFQPDADGIVTIFGRRFPTQIYERQLDGMRRHVDHYFTLENIATCAVRKLRHMSGTPL